MDAGVFWSQEKPMRGLKCERLAFVKLLEEMVKYTRCDKLASAQAGPPKQEEWVGLSTVEIKLAI